MKLNQLEFWIATALCVFVIYMNLLSTYEPTQEYIMFRIVPGLLMILGTYFTFLAINNVIIPKHLPERNWKQIAFECTGVMLVLLAVFTVADQLRPPGYPFRVSVERSFLLALPTMGWITGILVIYSILKYGIHNSNSTARTEKENLFLQLTLTTIIWLTVLAIVLSSFIGTTKDQFVTVWISAIPFAWLIYFLDRFKFLPDNHRKIITKRAYYFRLGCAVLLTFTFFFIIWRTTWQDMNIASYTAISLLCLLISLLSSRFSYSQHLKQTELLSLKTDLGKSSADLQFLRSQINPHFLFNVLNTLYGTAIQENADRTSEGIQKLGDMMRFMLHENTLDAIPVAREIDYLKDYIYLQKLRIVNSDQIHVEVNLPENPCHQTIAPMLLIPFVENAFKHGVSLQNRSWITISLHCEANRLDFDIYNSLHPKRETDTERFQGGIGLANVKQRLELLYPGKHELTIRQSQTEYFVHMTMFL